MDFTTQRVFITGGTRGIGWEMAKQLRERGAAVAICGRSRDRIDEIVRGDSGIMALRADLSDLDALPELADRVRAELGPPTILVNNAGVQFNDDWAETSPERRVERARLEATVNLTSPVTLTALFLDDLLAAPEAAVVNVTSILAAAPKTTAPVYCATKAGLRSFTRALRDQMAGHPNVRVVEVVPPLVDTAMTSGRGDGKIPPARVASEAVRGIAAGRDEVHVGKAKLIRILHALSPSLVARILRKV